MTTHSQKLQKVREWIVKANPEIEKERLWREGLFGKNNKRLFVHRPIRLSDVLLAMGTSRDPNYCVALDGNIWYVGAWGYDKKVCNWNLRTDDLDHQSPETIDFLFSLQQ